MIRQMKDSDLHTVMRIWIEGNLDAHGFVDGDYWRGNYASVRRSLPESEVYVYDKRSEVTGFIGLKGDYIAGLFVDRQSRGQGIGKALLDYVKKRHDTLSLHVFEKNRGAVRFYIREGFTAVNRGANSDTWEKEFLMRWGS